MSNMSYCKFENTLNDLRDCVETISEEQYSEKGRASREEKQARHDLITECKELLESLGYEVIESLDMSAIDNPSEEN